MVSFEVGQKSMFCVICPFGASEQRSSPNSMSCAQAQCYVNLYCNTVQPHRWCRDGRAAAAAVGLLQSTSDPAPAVAAPSSRSSSCRAEGRHRRRPSSFYCGPVPNRGAAAPAERDAASSRPSRCFRRPHCSRRGRSSSGCRWRSRRAGATRPTMAAAEATVQRCGGSAVRDDDDGFAAAGNHFRRKSCC